MDIKPRRRGRPSTSEGNGNPIDVHVGRRIKTRRLVRGLTQDELAKAVDLSFQQVQKYERGANRVSGGRLYELAKALNVPIQYFFDDYTDPATGEPAGQTLREDQMDFEGIDRLGDAELSELVRAFYRLGNPALRRSLIQLVLSLDFVQSEKPAA